MRDYLLLLHEDPSETSRLSPTEMQALIERYIAWGREVAEAGRMVTGHKLTEEGGRVVRRSGGAIAVTDGPYVEAREIVGGLYVIRAEDYEDAVRIAGSCPHAEIGWIEVREIEAVGD
ncbi:MAG: transcription initiation protein [Gemmatimonadetes bacterium]|nr:transcription initiation protein [Gemmatimonadota bacterium]MCA9763360.1 transcription initiation protein [Gemmatimonadota bacterium]MCB9518161.1 transcription initiation protein [Gemmatimonadales bacterium]HPF62642.1 YciI family protein [Gemmatimonadales bacterium]HRX19600.1 YciI family protein [Gemmatimonadales bacterium]